MAPKVSIVCPTFNGATRGYLREAIESALNQTFRGFELIIVNRTSKIPECTISFNLMGGQPALAMLE